MAKTHKGKPELDLTPEKPKAKKTLVTLLLDRSYSMQEVREATIGAINAYIGELRASEADIRFSLVLFDSDTLGGISLKKVHVARPIAEVPDLTWADYEPRGGTPLIDAAYTTIKAVAASLEGGRDKDTNVVVAIQTDGDENSSRNHSWTELKSLVSEKEELGWEMIFMGAGINAYKQAGQMGISGVKTVSYGADRIGTREVFAATAANVSAYASGLRSTTEYSDLQKRAAGDAFWKPGA